MRSRNGLTKVECVVIIACIAIMLGLLIPAVDTDTGGSRRNQCATNLKNLALAAVQFENSSGQLPGYLNDFGTYDATESSGEHAAHRKIGTWAVALMPWLDAQPTYEWWSDDRFPIVSRETPGEGITPDGYVIVAAPDLVVFQCQKDETVDEQSGGRNSYITNNAMHHRGPHGEDEWTIVREDGESTKIDFARSMSVPNGVFNNKVQAVDSDGATVALGPSVRLDDFRDGQGFTMLFSESSSALPWHRISDEPMLDRLMNDRELPFRYPESSRFIHGMVWHYEDPEKINGAAEVQPVHQINGLATDSATRSDLARPSSDHVDGINAAFADGATRFITDSIDYRVYQALLTPQGSLSDVPQRDTTFDEMDF